MLNKYEKSKYSKGRKEFFRMPKTLEVLKAKMISKPRKQI